MNRWLWIALVVVIVIVVVWYLGLFGGAPGPEPVGSLDPSPIVTASAPSLSVTFR